MFGSILHGQCSRQVVRMCTEYGHQRAGAQSLSTAADSVQGILQQSLGPHDIHCHSRDAVIVHIRQNRRQACIFASRRVGLDRSLVKRVPTNNTPDNLCSLGKSVFIIHHDIIFIFNSM